MHFHNLVVNVLKYIPRNQFMIFLYPSILAKDLVEKLLEQIKPFSPGYTLGESAETIKRPEAFFVTTNKGTIHKAPVVA